MLNVLLNAGGSFEALSRDGRIAVASSVIVFIVTSILFFIVDFLRMCHCWQIKAKNIEPQSHPQGPLYDNILPNKHKSDILELKENIAYGPVQPPC